MGKACGHTNTDSAGGLAASVRLVPHLPPGPGELPSHHLICLHGREGLQLLSPWRRWGSGGWAGVVCVDRAALRTWGHDARAIPSASDT